MNVLIVLTIAAGQVVDQHWLRHGQERRSCRSRGVYINIGWGVLLRARPAGRGRNE